MIDLILLFVMVGFAMLGVIGLLIPGRIAVYFGNKSINNDQRNELRAVYGGLPLGVTLLGILALAGSSPLSIQQTLWVYASLLLGMVVGRLIALCVERPTSKSYLFLGLEVVFGGIALYGFSL